MALQYFDCGHDLSGSFKKKNKTIMSTLLLEMGRLVILGHVFKQALPRITSCGALHASSLALHSKFPAKIGKFVHLLQIQSIQLN